MVGWGKSEKYKHVPNTAAIFALGLTCSALVAFGTAPAPFVVTVSPLASSSHFHTSTLRIRASVEGVRNRSMENLTRTDLNLVGNSGGLRLVTYST